MRGSKIMCRRITQLLCKMPPMLSRKKIPIPTLRPEIKR
jgi:hypothetical protein